MVSTSPRRCSHGTILSQRFLRSQGIGLKGIQATNDVLLPPWAQTIALRTPKDQKVDRALLVVKAVTVPRTTVKLEVFFLNNITITATIASTQKRLITTTIIRE